MRVYSALARSSHAGQLDRALVQRKAEALAELLGCPCHPLVLGLDHCAATPADQELPSVRVVRVPACDIRVRGLQPVRQPMPQQEIEAPIHARAFIALSPFLVIASSDKDGRGDATPRGDAPGFVAVLDDTTLLIPDRPGNRRVDTMLNVAENPRVGLLFLVPGINETLRINGPARFTHDMGLLKPLAVNGKDPVAGLLIDTEEVYFHCGKALIRSHLWDQDAKVERSRFPSLGRILADQVGGTGVAESERSIEEGYRTKLY